MAKKDALQFEKDLSEIEQAILAVEETGREYQKEASSRLAELRQRFSELQKRRFASLSPWQRVQLARHPERPQASDYAALLLDDLLELHGDRLFRDDQAIFGGFAQLGDEKILFLGHRKGKTTREKIDANFGSAHPEGYRKAIRLMLLAEKFGLPVVSLIDTPGAYPGIEAEERGQAQAIAANLLRMSVLAVPVVAATIGEGGSGGALGIGVGDRILILENAYYSVISPEGCAGILWRDGTRAEDAADTLKLTAVDLLALGLVDEIIPEPSGGAHKDPGTAAATLKEALLRHVKELRRIPPDELVHSRYEKLRKMGAFERTLVETP
ncbi:MAG: acetyl-CoA carboxylase carboxyltransferase subunit alpha [Planctomycetes bacterium]|nr:acetyl-CoA carboxylase carboxyltransferase subunit alpha [Planctomycetota bacterium]